MNKLLLASARISALLLLLAIVPAPAHAGLTDGLVGYWTLDGTDVNWATGVVTDRSGQGNSGKVVSMSTTTSPAAGKIGQGLKFDGTNDAVSIGINEFGSPSSFTISAWVKTATSTGYQTIMSEYQAGVCGDAMLYIAPSTGYVSYNDGASGNNNGNTSVIDNKWHHVVYVYNTVTGQHYVDGVAQTSSSAAAWRATCTLDVKIGALVNDTRVFDGTIDDTRFYNRALSAAEIKQLYNIGATKYAMTPIDSLKKGLVAHWTFDGMSTVWTSASAGTTLDSSGSGYTGTLTNMSRSTSTSAGKIGQAFRFNGSVQYVAYGNDLRDSDTQGTVTGWFKPAYNGASAHLIVQTTSGDDNKLFRVIAESAGAAVQAYNNGAGFNDYVSATGGSTTNWKHVAVTSNGSTYTIYIDGVSRSLTADSGSNAGRWFNSISSGTQIYRSCYLNATYTNTCSGDVDDIRIYNRALSAAEVKQLYNLGATKYGMTPTDTLKNGLVGHWTFDGNNTAWSSASAGTVRDSSPSANTGTLTNMSRSNSPAAGIIGQGLTFDGSDDYMSATAPSISSVTISSWVRVKSLPSAWSAIVMSKDGGVSTYPDWWLELYDNGGINIFFEKSPSGPYGTSVVSPALNTWYHVAVTNDGTTLNVYVNGVFARSTTGYALVNSNTSFYASYPYTTGESYGTKYFNGALDDVRVYSRALSAAEIKQLYSAGRTTSN